MKTYLQVRDEVQQRYLSHQSFWTRCFCGQWGHLHDEAAFNKIHAAVTQAIAQYGPFDLGPPWSASGDTFTRVAPAVHPLTVSDSASLSLQLEGTWDFDRNEAIKVIVTAIIAIAISLLFPPAAIIAGFLADIIVALICWTIASLVVELVSGYYGASPEDHALQLQVWANESRAA